MHVALADLALDHLWVVYPGTRIYSLAERVTALPVTQLQDIVNRTAEFQA
jgi:hypothetical protein